MAFSETVVKLLMFVGQLVLALFYGSLGTLMTVLLCITLGPRKFFRREQRAKPPSAATDPVYGDHGMIKLKSSGIDLHYVSKGTTSQPLMLFVHGFPECWYTWRHQMKYFSKKYRVVAIDQRGYGLSSKPSQIKDYEIEVLARDVADVIEQLGHKSCVLVAHDWGGIVSWATTILHPHLVDQLIIMNCPHPTAFLKNISLNQLRRSWYMFFYQTPWIPELLLQANDFGIFNRVFLEQPMGMTNASKMTKDDMEVFKYTFSQKGTTTAALNYYRALFRHQPNYSRTRIDQPVLIIWGCLDGALGEPLADASVKYCSDVQLRKVRGASHWVQQDEPDEVNTYMESFLDEKSLS